MGSDLPSADQPVAAPRFRMSTLIFLTGKKSCGHHTRFPGEVDGPEGEVSLSQITSSPRRQRPGLSWLSQESVVTVPIQGARKRLGWFLAPHHQLEEEARSCCWAFPSPAPPTRMSNHVSPLGILLPEHLQLTAAEPG